MFFIISKILDFLISPLNWILLLFIWSFVCKDKAKKQRKLKWGIALLFIFSNPFILNAVMGAWEIKAIEADDLKQQYSAGIMLGGTIRYYNSNIKRPVFGSGADRYVQTMELFFKHKISHIVLTSGSGSLIFDQVREADLLQQQLFRMGLDSSQVLAESNSRNTFENAKFTAQLLQEKKLEPPYVLITSAFHMRRSLLCFKKAGVAVIPFAVDQHSGTCMLTPDKTIIPSVEVLLDWNILIHEWMGVASYRLMGYL